MKKFFAIILILLASLAFWHHAIAQTEKAPISIFTRQDCVHCQDEKAFLNNLQQSRNDFEIFYYDIADVDNKKKFEELTKLENLSKSTPITLVGNTIIQGFATAETTGKRIEQLLDESRGKKTLTIEEYLAAGGSGGNVEQVDDGVCDEEGCVAEIDDLVVNIPFYGPLDLKPYSLPAIATILGFIDGFNPCAMWVLVTFLLVLMQIGDKKRMWQIAGLFILAEAVMYYLILNVWFTAWDFIGLDRIVTPIIGMVAIGGGIFFLWEGYKSDGTCKVANPEQRRKTHNKIKELAAKPMTWMAAFGVIGLAFSVNIIEFACSIGIPQAFTKIVEINMLSLGVSQGLMALYILFYMIDDLLVFGLALWSFEHLHLAQKYSKWSNIVGGILMLVLGLLLIFNPSALKF
jgi:cytochrome c biogenesis protein CcdA/glutaredoxin